MTASYLSGIGTATGLQVAAVLRMRALQHQAAQEDPVPDAHVALATVVPIRSGIEKPAFAPRS
jgi:hypothetical protein